MTTSRRDFLRTAGVAAGAVSPGNVDMIGKPERVGNSEGQGGNAALLPALKVKQFHFSSQSEAV